MMSTEIEVKEGTAIELVTIQELPEITELADDDNIVVGEGVNAKKISGANFKAPFIALASQNIIGTITTASQAAPTTRPDGTPLQGGEGMRLGEAIITAAATGDVTLTGFGNAVVPEGTQGGTMSYDKGSNTWSLAPGALSTEGLQKTATLLTDGVAAGLAESGGSTKTLQLIDDAKLNIADINVMGNVELFDAAKVLNGYSIDLTTGSISATAGFSISGVIAVLPNTAYIANNLGTVHYGIPFRFTDSNGNYISISTSAQNANSFTFTTPLSAAFVQFTVKTAAPGDNMNVNTISLKQSPATPTKISGIKGIPLYSDMAVNKTDIVLKNNKNIFPIGKSLGGYYDLTTFLFKAATGYSCTPLFAVKANTQYTISGLGAAHFGIAVAFYKADGETHSATPGIVSPQDVPNYTFATPSDCAYVGYTWHTAKSGDNSVESSQQIELGAIATEYTAPISGIGSITGYVIPAGPVFDDPVAPSDPVSLGYLNAKIDRNTDGKVIFIFGDSITTTTGTTNWPTWAMSILGIPENNVHNFAVSGAHWENFSTATSGQQLSDQVSAALATGITPDIIVISIGTNSFQSTNFGSYTASMGKALNALDITNVMDACRSILAQLAQTFPYARKFYGTPLQRATYTIDAERVFNNQYVQMANNYNYIIIDAFNESGYLHEFMQDGVATIFSKDGLHPNTTFQPIMGAYYAKRILETYI